MTKVFIITERSKKPVPGCRSVGTIEKAGGDEQALVEKKEESCALLFSHVSPWSMIPLVAPCFFRGLSPLTKSLEQAKKNTINYCSTFFSGLTTTQTHWRRAVRIISCKGAKDAQSFCKKNSDVMFIPLHLGVLWRFTFDKKLVMIYYFQVWGGLKSWLKCFNPTPFPRVILE